MADGSESVSVLRENCFSSGWWLIARGCHRTFDGLKIHVAAFGIRAEELSGIKLIYQ